MLEDPSEPIAISPEFQKKVHWAGSCPASSNSCTELVDARSSIASNILFNNSFALHLSTSASGRPPAVPPVQAQPPVGDGTPCPQGTHLEIMRNRDVVPWQPDDGIARVSIQRDITGTTYQYTYDISCQLGEETRNERFGVGDTIQPSPPASSFSVPTRLLCPSGATAEDRDILWRSSGRGSLRIRVCVTPKTVTLPAGGGGGAASQEACAGNPDLWDPAVSGSTTESLALGNRCVVNNGRQNVRIEPNRLYVLDVTARGQKVRAAVTQCGPSNAIEFFSPDGSMGVASQVEGQPAAELSAIPPAGREGVMSGRFLLLHS